VEWAAVSAQAPQFLPHNGTDPRAALPLADVVVITWTHAEWAALDHIFCDSASRFPPLAAQAVESSISRNHGESWTDAWDPSGRWRDYRHHYDEIADMLPRTAPSLERGAWGSWCRLRLPASGRTVLLFKSDMHLTTDGVGVPLRRLVRQLAGECGPELLITTGTAGGTRLEDCIGSVAVTSAAEFRLSGEFADLSYNNQTYSSSRAVESSVLDRIRPLLLPTPVRYEDLETLAQSLAGPALGALLNAAIEPGHLSPRVRAGTDPVLTNNGYDAATTAGEFARYAALEMDDAVVAMVCAEFEQPFAIARNISDPILNPGLEAEQLEGWSGLLYREYGLHTSFNGALCAWSMAAG